VRHQPRNNNVKYTAWVSRLQRGWSVQFTC